MTTGKTIALTRQISFGKVMSLLFSRSYIVIKMELHIFVTVFIGSRVSLLWLYCHSGLDSSLLWDLLCGLEGVHSIPGLCPYDASSTAPVVTTKSVS